MVVVAAVLVVRYEDHRVLPERTIPHRVHHLRHERLSSLYVGRWMLVIFVLRSKQPEIGIDERHLRQRAYACRSTGLRQKHEKGQKVWVHACRPEQPEARSLWRILKIVGPGNSIFIQQIKDRSPDRLISSWRRKLIACTQMPKGSRRHEISAICKRWPKHRGEIAVVHREVCGQVVVERNLLLVIKAHGLIVGRILDALVQLLRGVVHSHESIAQRLPKSAVRIQEIGFFVRTQPGMIEIGRHASSGIMERKHRGAVVIEVGVETR